MSLSKSILYINSIKQNVLHHFAMVVLPFLLVMSSETVQGQKGSKLESLPFCGIRSKDIDYLKKYLLPEVAFLKIKSGDTLVDIGAQSGAYDASIAVVANLNDVHFILVDIDSVCLNQTKLNNVISHFSAFNTSLSAQQFSFVNNTKDSLYLPADRYQKALLRNVIHEIRHPDAFVKNIYEVLRSSGELIVLEMIPTKKGKLHGGCRMPLYSFDELLSMFQKAGFLFIEKQDLLEGNKPRKQMLRFIKP